MSHHDDEWARQTAQRRAAAEQARQARDAATRAETGRAVAALAAHLLANPPTETDPAPPRATDRKDDPPVSTTDDTAKALQKMRADVGLPPAPPAQPQPSTTPPNESDAAVSAALAQMRNATGIRLTTNQK